jgi:hypothetical protein
MLQKILFFIFGFVWQKIIFIQNKMVKINLRVCLINNFFDKKFLNKKCNQPNKDLILDPKQNQSG